MVKLENLKKIEGLFSVDILVFSFENFNLDIKASPKILGEFNST